MKSDSLSECVAMLRERTFVAAVDYHEEIDSTNNRALARIAAGEIDAPTLIVADRQSAGRGRGANSWWSSDGGLTFSLAIPIAALDVPEQRWPLVSLTAAVALCDALATSVPQATLGVKWPNDVFANNRKIAGILVEVAPAAAKGRVMVVGIGLNVNNRWAAAPEAIRNVGTSLFDITGKLHDRAELLTDILIAIGTRLSDLRGHDAALASAWQSLCFLQGRHVTVATPAEEVRGVCQGIEPDGALLLTTPAGPVRLVGGVVKSFE